MKRILLIAAALMFTATVAPAEAEAARRPAVVVQVAPARVWVPAATVWNVRLGRYVTVAGHWKTPPRAGVHWVPGHWEGRGPHKRWVSGRWAPTR